MGNIAGFDSRKMTWFRFLSSNIFYGRHLNDPTYLQNMLIHSRKKGFKAIFREKRDPMINLKEKYRKRVERFEAT